MITHSISFGYSSRRTGKRVTWHKDCLQDLLDKSPDTQIELNTKYEELRVQITSGGFFE